MLPLGILLLSGCGTVQGWLQPSPSPYPQQAADAPATPPQSLDNAVIDLADALLTRTAASSPDGVHALVIDPFLEQATGTETVATRTAVTRLVEQVRGHYPSIELRAFTLAGIADKPRVLLGSIAGITETGAPALANGLPWAYRIRAVLAEPRTGRVLGTQAVLVKAADISTTLAPFFRDSPGWLPDPAAAAYLRTVEARPGAAMDPAYLQGITVGGLVADGMVAYEAGRYREALDRYADAERLPAGDQMRVHNGLYLSAWALGRRQEAEEAFGRVIDFGLRQERLAVKFLFRPGSTALWSDPIVGAPYEMWIRQIALKTEERTACLMLTGHASPTGSAAENDRLSLGRAERLRSRLIAVRPELRERTQSEGVGARQPLVGTGADNASDVLDRRVELSPRACAMLPRQ